MRGIEDESNISKSQTEDEERKQLRGRKNARENEAGIDESAGKDQQETD